MRCLIRRLTAVDLVISIQNIILQNLHSIQIALSVRIVGIQMALVKTDHGSLMDVQQIQHMSRKLIRLYIPFHNRKIQIIPHDIFCLKQTSILHLFRCPLKARQMVSVQHQNRRFHPCI